MPGHVSGGHSGSFGGGGHSGGFSGGHGGSFGSSHTSSHTNTSRSVNTGVFSNHTSRYYGNRGTSGRGGCLSPVVIVIVIAVLILGSIIGVIKNMIVSPSDTFRSYTEEPEALNGQYEEETEIIPAREKLDSSLCTPLDAYVGYEGIEAFSESEEKKLVNSLTYFYEKTGVQPYVVIGDLEDERFADSYDVEDYLYETYLELFEEDEGHYLFLLLIDEYDNYQTYTITGDDAYYVIDDEANETVLDLFDQYASEASEPVPALCRTFEEAGKTLMEERTVVYEPYAGNEENADEDFFEDFTFSDRTSYIVGILAVVGRLAVLAAVVIFIVVRRKKKKRGGAEAAKRPEIHFSEAKPQEPPAASQTAQRGSYEVPKANYPIKCPHCGATAYPNDNGTCQYCGSQIVYTAK